MARTCEADGAETEELETMLPASGVARRRGLPVVRYIEPLQQSVAWAWIGWMLFSAFLLLLPVYTPYLNKHFTGTMCVAPTWQLMENSEIYCNNGEDLTKLARQQGRFNWRGQPAVCGCGQGIFGEDICSMGFYGHPNTSGLTVSNYIGTPVGIAVWLMFVGGPIRMMWLYGTGAQFMLKENEEDSAKPWMLRLSAVTMVVFQISFAFFCCATGCVFLMAHETLTIIFAAAAITHYINIGCIGLSRGTNVPMKVVLSIGSIFAMSMIMFWIVGALYKNCNVEPGRRHEATDFCQKLIMMDKLPFYFEATAIVGLFAVTPALITVGVA